MQALSKFNIFRKKSSVPEEAPPPHKAESTVHSIKVFFSKKGFKSEKFNKASEKVVKAAVASGLSEQEILDNWEIFLIVIYLEDKDAFPNRNEIPDWTTTPRHNPKLIPAESSKPKKLTIIVTESPKTSSEPNTGKEEVTTLPSSVVTETKPSPIPKKVISMKEIDEMVKDSNPRDLFTKGVEIGRGGFGTVYAAKDKSTGKPVALKYLDLNWEDSNDKKKVVNEVYLMKECQHDNIVNFLGAFRHQNKVWISMEYCDAGTLEELIPMSLSENVISHIAQQVAAGIAYLHGQNRLHRDIKSSNILMNFNGKVKVADLGLSIQGVGQQHKGFAGSKYWCAPEMIQRVKYTEKVDIWSFGAVLFEMAQGHPPYAHLSSFKALFYTATIGADKLNKPKQFSEDFRDLMDCCFQMNYTGRPSAQELLKHPFLQIECKFKEVESALKAMSLMRATSGL